MTVTYSDINYFLEVAHTRNISRAAERLGLTQPSLSSAMKRLEDSLGVTLLVRGRTGVQLTQAGTELSRRGRLLLLNWEQLKSDINKRETGVSGQYVIGCHPSVGQILLPKFLPELTQNHPELEIKLTHDLSRKITERVVSFEVDFGIVVNPIRHPDLVIKELRTDLVKFWTSAKPSRSHGSGASEGLNQGVLICDPELMQVKSLLNNLDKRKLSFKRVIHSSNLDVIRELTRSGVGIGILPSLVVSQGAPHDLKPLDDQLPIFKDKICLVYRADIQKSKASQTIIEAIRKALKLS